MATQQFYGTGRRKSSVARVRLVPGNGNITINGRTIDEYFGLETLKVIVRQPLVLTKTLDKFDIIVKVEGRTVDEVIEMLKGIPCGKRVTSCPDQVAKALEKYKKI